MNISGTVIAHGITISSGATGYVFNGVNNGALTVTAGGIIAQESVVFNVPVSIGGPQAWTVAGGRTLTVNGALHTIISDLTFNGAGNTVIAGAIDGGGVMNTVGGATPGGLIQAGAGTVTLSGNSNFAGNITVGAGAGPLNLAPAGGSAAYTGGLFGGGSITIAAGTVSLGGPTSTFSGKLNVLPACTLQFTPAAGVVNSFNAVIGGGGSLAHNGPGTTILSAPNNYGGNTTVSSGALQANIGVGIPAGSFLVLDGGVLQSNGSGTVNFTRGLVASGATFQWTANGGGFSAGGGPMVVNVGNGAAAQLGHNGRQPDRGNAPLRLDQRRGGDHLPELHQPRHRRPHDSGRRQPEHRQRLCRDQRRHLRLGRNRQERGGRAETLGRQQLQRERHHQRRRVAGGNQRRHGNPDEQLPAA